MSELQNLNLATLDVVAGAVKRAAEANKKIADRIWYSDKDDHIILFCDPFFIAIPRAQIDELKEASLEDMQGMTLSPSGSTIKVPRRNIYLETASVVANYIFYLKRHGEGGILFDLMSPARIG